MKATLRFTSFIASIGCTIFSATAADVTKSSTGTDLLDGASWGGTAPTAAGTAAWSGSSLGAGLTLGSAASWQGIKVTGAASAIGISGAGTLTLGTNGINLAASTVDLSLGNSVTLNGSQTWKAAAGRSLSVSGAVDGTGDLSIGAVPATITWNPGGFLSTSSGSPTLAFANTTLADISGANGIIAGGWITGSAAAAGYHLTNNGSTAAVQLQFYDGNSFTKVVRVQLVQSGLNVMAYQDYAKYKTGNVVGDNFDPPYAVTGSPPVGSGGYGVTSLTATLGAIPTGTITLSGNNTYTGATNLVTGTLVVSGGNAIPNASAVTMSTGTTLRLDSSETVGSLAGAGTANLQGNTLTAGGNNATTTFSGTLSGTGGTLVKSGTGTLTLPVANSFTGSTTISQGAIVINNSSSLGTGGTVVMNDANTGANNTSLFVQDTGGNDIILSRPITVANQPSGTVTIGSNRVAPTGAARTFFDGLITLNSKDVTLSATLTDRVHYRGGITGTGNVTVSGGMRTIFSDTTSTPFDGEGAAPYNFNGNLTLTGTGTTLQFNSDIDLTNVGTVTVETGTTLNGAYGKTLGINALAGSGTIGNAGGTAGTVNIKVGISGGGGNFSGVIQNNAAPVSLTKTGAGNQTLSGAAANTYTGLTTVNAGTLTLDKNDGVIAIPGHVTVTGTGTLVTSDAKSGRIADTSNVTIDGSVASFQFGSNQNDTINTLAVNNGGTVNIGGTNSNLRPNGGITSTGGGSITMSAGGEGLNFNGATRTVTVANNNLAVSAPITNGGLTKAGSGTLTLTASSSYTGATTVNAGTLVMGDGAADTFATAVTVASGATLAGSGSITGNLTTTGTVAPGNSIGDLNITGDVTWKGGDGSSNLWGFELDNTSNDSDTLKITGAFNKDTSTGSTFKFNFMGASPNQWGRTYTLVEFTTTNFTDGNDFSFTGLSGSYTNGSFTLGGSTLTFTAIPEPTTALAGLLLGVGLLRRRRGQ